MSGFAEAAGDRCDDAAEQVRSRSMQHGKIRVRTAEGYPNPFCFDLGQRNTQMTKGKLIRGSSVLPFLDAVTFSNPSGCDLLHTLNAVPIATRLPYVVTFESYLPRVPDDRPVPLLERILVRRLMRAQCKRIVAFSDFAMRQFRSQIARYPGAEGLLDKSEVLRPAAPVRRSEPKPAPAHKLKLIFVGRDFARKGGPAVVRAHEALAASGVPVETTVVSSLGWDPKGVVGPTSRALIEAEHERLARCGARHVVSLPNASVLSAMEEADFLLLPTINDTFGFVCLEAMGVGTPVIATRTYAMPEIVSPGQSGWLLDLPTDALGKWEWLSRRGAVGYDSAYLDLMDDLGRQMAFWLTQFWKDRQSYPALSAGALARMRSDFDPAAARDRLEIIYELATGSLQIC